MRVALNAAFLDFYKTDLRPTELQYKISHPVRQPADLAIEVEICAYKVRPSTCDSESRTSTFQPYIRKSRSLRKIDFL